MDKPTKPKRRISATHGMVEEVRASAVLEMRAPPRVACEADVVLHTANRRFSVVVPIDLPPIEAVALIGRAVTVAIEVDDD